MSVLLQAPKPYFRADHFNGGGSNTAARDAAERLDLVSQGGLDEEGRSRELKVVQGSVARMRRAVASDVIQAVDRIHMDGTLNAIEGRLAVVDDGERADPLGRLPDGKREAYREVIQLIYECSVNRVGARTLVDRIMQRLAE